LRLGPDPDRQLDHCGADHQRGAEEVAKKHRATLAAADQRPEYGGRRDTAKRGPDGAEERYRQRPGFEREALASSNASLPTRATRGRSNHNRFLPLNIFSERFSG
jgi:hypothetical protein